MTNTFPQYYRPRPYQTELHKMWREKRIGVAVFPRQAGKDVAMGMEMTERRLKTAKSTGVYISLNNPTVRDIIWDKTYYDPVEGKMLHLLKDNVPSDMVAWKNTSMVGEFSNGSRLKFQGYFQSGNETSGVGSAFQDYAITELALFHREDPIPRILPIITSEYEEKKLMVASTPRGKRRNPLWQLISSHENDPKFQLIVRTIDDLNEMMRREGLPPVRSEQQLELDREAYLKRFGNDRMFLQEYYCSFDEMDAAAVYGEAYLKLIEEKRAIDFNLDKNHPVYVAFDIGASGQQSDATSWVAFQWFNNRLFLYDAGEGHGKALPEYVDDLQQKHWFPQLQRIILPWDSESHERAIKATPADMMRQRFPNVDVLAKSKRHWNGGSSGGKDIITDIQQVRMALYNTIIHKTNCDWVLECLENYKYEFNRKLQEWSGKPLHDKHSHMMDAVRYAVMATKELDFFSGSMYSSYGGEAKSYEEDWEGIW